jgi:hypothetical protein
MPLGDELSIFDAATGRAFALNRTAADVFALADGRTTLAEIVLILSRAYDAEPVEVAADVTPVVRELTEAGLLVAEADE